MEIKKESKMDIISVNPLHKYIKGIFTLIGKDGESTVFLNEDGLFCKTKDICVKLSALKEGNSLFSQMESNKEYELCRLPGNIYRLNVIGYDKEKEEKYRAIIDCQKKGKYLCHVDSNEFGAISKIAINSRYCLKDSYSKSIEKFGECDAFLSENGFYMILDKSERSDQITFIYSKAYFAVSLEDLEKERAAKNK